MDHRKMDVGDQEDQVKHQKSDHDSINDPPDGGRRFDISFDQEQNDADDNDQNENVQKCHGYSFTMVPLDR
jgi:hypothetical protein